MCVEGCAYTDCTPDPAHAAQHSCAYLVMELLQIGFGLALLQSVEMWAPRSHSFLVERALPAATSARMLSRHSNNPELPHRAPD